MRRYLPEYIACSLRPPATPLIGNRSDSVRQLKDLVSNDKCDCLIKCQNILERSIECVFLKLWIHEEEKKSVREISMSLSAWRRSQY